MSSRRERITQPTRRRRRGWQAALRAGDSPGPSGHRDGSPYWAWVTEPCARWPVLAAGRYTGPWNTPTAHPILVVGNTTPYQDSIAMAHEVALVRLSASPC